MNGQVIMQSNYLQILKGAKGFDVYEIQFKEVFVPDVLMTLRKDLSTYLCNLECIGHRCLKHYPTISKYCAMSETKLWAKPSNWWDVVEIITRPRHDTMMAEFILKIENRLFALKYKSQSLLSILASSHNYSGN